MKYNILINQKAIIDNGWLNIKANHIAVLEVIRSFSCSNTCQKLQDENGLWFWVKPSLIIAQIPMFDIKERRCQSLMKELNDVGLIELNPNNRSLRRTYLRIGKAILNYDNYQENRTLQNNASTMQNNTSKQCNLLQTSMQDIADNNTTNNNNINNNSLDIQVLNFLNEKKQSKINFNPTPSNLKDIRARLKENYNLDDFKKVILFKINEWGADVKMKKYIRPQTLFGSKFGSYLVDSHDFTETTSGTGDDNFEYKPTDEPKFL